jgi:predicted nucleic acid-binding protein
VTITAIRDIKNYRFTERDLIFLDANILLPVYGPNANRDPNTYIYSDALMRMRASKSKMFIDVLVVSEFINRFAHWAFDQLPPEIKPSDFKYFRNSAEFKDVALEIADNVRRIMDYAVCCDSEFGSMNINELLIEYEQGKSDFNDQVIARLCKKRGFILATNDGDFRSCGVDLLTANNRLLR